MPATSSHRVSSKITSMLSVCLQWPARVNISHEQLTYLPRWSDIHYTYTTCLSTYIHGTQHHEVLLLLVQATPPTGNGTVSGHKPQEGLTMWHGWSRAAGQPRGSRWSWFPTGQEVGVYSRPTHQLTSSPAHQLSPPAAAPRLTTALPSAISHQPSSICHLQVQTPFRISLHSRHI